MKLTFTKILRFCTILLLAMFTKEVLQAQQMAVSNYQLFRPAHFNPGFVPYTDLATAYLGHQQRNLSDVNWKTMTTFLILKSKPLGKSKNFGLGGYLTNEFEHTERRLAIGVTIANRLFETETMYLGVGFNLGLINWGSNYGAFRVYDRTDELLFRPTNFAELDAGAGLSFGLDNFYFRTEAQAWAAQIPGNLLSKSGNGIQLYPHVFAGGNFLVNIAPDIYMGPLLFYRNIFTNNPDIGTIQGAELDAGLRIDFDRPQLWVSGAWRLDNAAVSTAFGLQIVSTDTLGTRSQSAYFGDLFVSASYPLNNSRSFGPSIELGLNVAFGRVGEDGPKLDSLGLIHGAFWVNNGNMNTHRERRLTKTAPPGLYAESIVGEKVVELTYEWEDNQYIYAGETVQVAGDSGILSLGPEWIGVDLTLKNMIDEVVQEGLVPTNVGVSDIDSVEPLKDFVRMKVISNLRFDEIQAEFGAEGAKYKGEFVPEESWSDTLTIKFEYGDRYEPRDTFVKLWKGKLLSNLELAALKIYAMDRRLVHEMRAMYGSRYVFYREGDAIPETDKRFVVLGIPQVIPRNVNISVFQQTEVQLGFLRDPDWEPLAQSGRAARKKKQAKERDKPKKGGRKVRDQFREPVPDGND